MPSSVMIFTTGALAMTAHLTSVIFMKDLSRPRGLLDVPL
jgi:hypothetical protein